MKILVAARHLHPDYTSEGICTAKFVRLLSGAGHEVVCVSIESVLDGRGWPLDESWLGGARVRKNASAGLMLRSGRKTLESERNGAAARVSRLLRDKGDAVVAYLTGHGADSWTLVRWWRRVLQDSIQAEQPDVIVARGGGLSFEGHLALLTIQSNTPWLAHYHDPYPLSLYPEPYRRVTRLLSRQQELLHRWIVRRADVLTFPSERLLHWVLDGHLAKHRSKAHVVPHVALEPPTAGPTQLAPELWPVPAESFVLLHTGTLLEPRDPRPLLDAFTRFVGEDEAKRRYARLVFVGRIHDSHREYATWRNLEAAGLVCRITARVSYSDALAMGAMAAALVILEAPSPESPFFPGKLADYLWLRRPILALSPIRSATVDLLGVDYALHCEPQNVEAIATGIERLWSAWLREDLNRLLPSSSVRDTVSGPAVAHLAIHALEDAAARRSVARSTVPTTAIDAVRADASAPTASPL